MAYPTPQRQEDPTSRVSAEGLQHTWPGHGCLLCGAGGGLRLHIEELGFPILE